MSVSRAKRAAVTLALAYAGGSLPIVHLLGRGAGVDLRRVGSGNVGSANLTAAAGPLAGGTGWLADAAKGWLAITLSRRTGHGDLLTGGALLAALAGQCWPPFLGWQGGRGVATLVGGMLATDPADALPCLGVIAALASLRPLGRRLWRPATGMPRHGKAVPLGVLVGVCCWPAISAQRQRPGARTLAALGALALLLVRRATARPLPRGSERWPALRNRLLLDRDTWS